MSKQLTPCVGKCSTVFGDSVCRGCRRYDHEVIRWNALTELEMQAIWCRLDQQLNQIVLQHVHLKQGVSALQLHVFLQKKHIRVMDDASLGRLVFEVLRAVCKYPQWLEESGLDIGTAQLVAVWHNMDAQLYALAVASYELAWLRAAAIAEGLERL